jgi:uncharacterized protein (DUF2141 family)
MKGTGKIATNLFGIPTALYGFSNDATGTMGPPAFDSAAVDLAQEDLSITLHLR